MELNKHNQAWHINYLSSTLFTVLEQALHLSSPYWTVDCTADTLCPQEDTHHGGAGYHTENRQAILKRSQA